MLEWPLIDIHVVSFGGKKVFCIEIFAHVASVVVRLVPAQRVKLLFGWLSKGSDGCGVAWNPHPTAKACSVWRSRREDRSSNVNSTTYRQF